ARPLAGASKLLEDRLGRQHADQCQLFLARRSLCQCRRRQASESPLALAPGQTPPRASPLLLVLAGAGLVPSVGWPVPVAALALAVRTRPARAPQRDEAERRWKRPVQVSLSGAFEACQSPLAG